MFPQESLKNIRTPVFLVNTAYDYWQVRVTNPSNIMRTFVLSPFWFYCNSWLILLKVSTHSDSKRPGTRFSGSRWKMENL